MLESDSSPSGSRVFAAPIKSARMTYIDGISIKVINVANKMPKANEIAMGITILAIGSVSTSIGTRPEKVVTDVKTMALKRSQPASMLAVT